MELENVLSNQTGSNILIWKLNMIIYKFLLLWKSITKSLCIATSS